MDERIWQGWNSGFLIEDEGNNGEHIHDYADFVRVHPLVVVGIGIRGGSATEEYVGKFEEWESAYLAKGIRLGNAYVGRLSRPLCDAMERCGRVDDFYPKTLFVKRGVAVGVEFGQLTFERLDAMVEKYLLREDAVFSEL